MLLNGQKNKQKRVQIALKIGWSAYKEIQTLGCSHRSDQAQAPEFVSLITKAEGENLFESTLAKRLASPGALTKGQMDAVGSNMEVAKYDLENDYGKAALQTLYCDIMSNRAPEELNGVDRRQILR